MRVLHDFPAVQKITATWYRIDTHRFGNHYTFFACTKNAVMFRYLRWVRSLPPVTSICNEETIDDAHQ